MNFGKWPGNSELRPKGPRICKLAIVFDLRSQKRRDFFAARVPRFGRKDSLEAKTSLARLNGGRQYHPLIQRINCRAHG
jgi:hypothetical protein